MKNQEGVTRIVIIIIAIICIAIIGILLTSGKEDKYEKVENEVVKDFDMNYRKKEGGVIIENITEEEQKSIIEKATNTSESNENQIMKNVEEGGFEEEVERVYKPDNLQPLIREFDEEE